MTIVAARNLVSFAAVRVVASASKSMKSCEIDAPCSSFLPDWLTSKEHGSGSEALKEASACIRCSRKFLIDIPPAFSMRRHSAVQLKFAFRTRLPPFFINSIPLRHSEPASAFIYGNKCLHNTYLHFAFSSDCSNEMNETNEISSFLSHKIHHVGGNSLRTRLRQN